MKRIWMAKMRCYMPGAGGEFCSGQTVELDDSEVTDRHRALFKCLTEDEAKEDKAKKSATEDPDVKVMRDRLKNAKVDIPRGASDKTIRQLFKEKLGNTEQIAPIR